MLRSRTFLTGHRSGMFEGGVDRRLVPMEKVSDMLLIYSLVHAHLSANVWVCVSKSLGTISISGDRSVVEMVDWFSVSVDIDKLAENVRNGPPEVGKFSNFTVNLTPIPLGFAVAEMEPLTLPLGLVGLKNGFSGRVAV